MTFIYCFTMKSLTFFPPKFLGNNMRLVIENLILHVANNKDEEVQPCSLVSTIFDENL